MDTKKWWIAAGRNHGKSYLTKMMRKELEPETVRKEVHLKGNLLHETFVTAAGKRIMFVTGTTKSVTIEPEEH